MAYAPTTTNDDFWSKAGPGLLDFGLNLYSRNAAQNEAEERLKRARGPLFDASMGAATAATGQAGSFDPQQFANDRFAKQQALLKPVQDKQFADVLRTLYAKGQLGTGQYNLGLEGGSPTPGLLANPKIAAFFAAQNAQRSKDAFNALGEGQAYLDNLLKRAGTAQGNAAAAQSMGLEDERVVPSRATSNAQLLKGGLGVLKDTGILGDIFKPGGMIGQGVDWMKGIFADPVEPAYDFGGGWTYDDYGDWTW